MTVALTRLIIDQTDPLSLSFFRYGIAALVLLGIMVAGRGIVRMTRRDTMMISLLGVFMYAAFPYCMARALEDTTAARGALLFAVSHRASDRAQMRRHRRRHRGRRHRTWRE